MALAQEDIEQIQALIRQSIQATPEVGNANVRYELELREKTTRVEEELKHQWELLLTGFAQMEKRFEQMHVEFNKRFKQVDKRPNQIDKQLEKQSQAIMDIHQEIKLLMRWSFGMLLGIGTGIGILKLTG